MAEKLRRIARETVCEGKVLDFCRDTVVLPDGTVQEWDFVHHRRGGGACVVPVLPDGRILTIRQERPAIGRETLELPAGARNFPEEDTAVTASRELREETGYDAGRLTFLMRLVTADAWCDETTDVYLAEQLRKAGGQELDEAEDIRVEAHPAGELLRWIRSGRIQDAKTVAGITAYLAGRQIFSEDRTDG